MNSLQESYLKALNPTIAVKVKSLDKDTVPMEIVKLIHSTLTYRYKTCLDQRNGVIYVGKKV